MGKDFIDLFDKTKYPNCNHSLEYIKLSALGFSDEGPKIQKIRDVPLEYIGLSCVIKYNQIDALLVFNIILLKACNYFYPDTKISINDIIYDSIDDISTMYNTFFSEIYLINSVIIIFKDECE